MPPKPPTDDYRLVRDDVLWRGLNGNGTQLGGIMERLRTGADDTLDRDNEELNDLLDERAALSAEMWRREQGRK